MEGALQKLLAVVASLVLVAITSNGGGLQVANAQICNVSVNDLMACRPAVTPPKPKAPTKACCAGLSHANFGCLCTYRSSLPALGIDPTLALQLPGKCNLPHPANC